MPRKSPRSRRKSAAKPRLPARERPRATPGKGRAGAKKRAAGRATRAGHVSRGPRPTAAAAAPARRRPLSTGKSASARPARARGPRFAAPDPARVAAILDLLERTYPDANTALDFHSPLQLLVATILSAQCTDARVNLVTPTLFARFPDAAALAGATQGDLEEIIRSTGFFRNKAKAIRACCADLVAKHGGEVPRTLEELTVLHGVGRKTANVVLGNAYDIPGLVVDTHVTRVSNRLGFTRETDAVKIEFELMSIVPREKWTRFSHWLILHGRRICIARKPWCSKCPLFEHCPRVGVTVSQ